jgi:hypothetical protein
MRKMAETHASGPTLSEPLTTLSEPLTWEQICDRYPHQWVVLVEMVRETADYNSKLRTARVAGAGKTRREPLVQSRPLRSGYSSFGHFFTGPITRSIEHLLR